MGKISDKAWLGPKPVIGIIGGIGSGKSLVARLMASEGCGVIDSDVLARDVLDEDAVRMQLVQWWGPGVLDAAGKVDRKSVGRIVFEKPDELTRLEKLVHPKVHLQRARLHAAFERDASVRAIVEDTPLLLEKGLDGDCDVLVFVSAPREQRLARVRMTRRWDEAELSRREKMQIALDSKAQRADYVIENDAGEAQCLAQVRRILSQILHQTA